jgi:2-dehydropantoate 2-reductase
LTGLRNTFQKAGFEMQIAPNIYSAIWAKLVANVAINPISALTGLRNGELLHDPDIVTIVEQVVSETVAVMQAAGVPTTVEDHLRHAKQVMEGTHDNVSSMLQDIRRGRRTEIDAINGSVVRLGDELGVPVPTNRWLAAFVRNRENEARNAG